MIRQLNNIIIISKDKIDHIRWKIMVKIARNLTNDMWGTKCSEYEEGCITCEVHKTVDLLEKFNPITYNS